MTASRHLCSPGRETDSGVHDYARERDEARAACDYEPYDSHTPTLAECEADAREVGR